MLGRAPDAVSPKAARGESRHTAGLDVLLPRRARAGWYGLGWVDGQSFE
jgi:hypothetical protein